MDPGLRRLVLQVLIAATLFPVVGCATTGGRRARRRDRNRWKKDDGAPKVGEIAPLFTLKSLDGEREVELAGFQGKRPVVLFFGSYT